MKILPNVLTAVFLVMFFAAAGSAQAVPKRSAAPANQAQPVVQALLSSPAYAELLLRRTELESDLESMLMEYTEDYPKIKETRYELALIQRSGVRLQNVKPSDAGKLTLALGKLMVRKAALETELWQLQNQYKDGHPEVKRAKKKVEIFDKAINEILG
jgi:uncharacterized protein involved in exopolysaccharide biosynthesis